MGPTKEEKGEHQLTEMFVFNPPKGLEGYRFYRIEYGGPNEYCVYEGAIWLPRHVNPEEIEEIINRRPE
jgi:hypothetical protein